jgi:BMFP domain-containing protein YqiC
LGTADLKGVAKWAVILGEKSSNLLSDLKQVMKTNDTLAGIGSTIDKAHHFLRRMNHATFLEARDLLRLAKSKYQITPEESRRVFNYEETKQGKLTEKETRFYQEFVKPLNEKAKANFLVNAMMSEGYDYTEVIHLLSVLSEFDRDIRTVPYDEVVAKAEEYGIEEKVVSDFLRNNRKLHDNYMHRIVADKDGLLTSIKNAIDGGKVSLKVGYAALKKTASSFKKSTIWELRGKNGERVAIARLPSGIFRFISNEEMPEYVRSRTAEIDKKIRLLQETGFKRIDGEPRPREVQERTRRKIEKLEASKGELLDKQSEAKANGRALIRRGYGGRSGQRREWADAGH